LELNGVKFVIEEHLGLWVKFEAKRIEQTKERPHGIRYSLTLHDRFNNRIIGFDNAHAVEYGKKINISPKRTYDHWHRDSTDEGRPYLYKNAGKLLEDFWHEVNKVVNKLIEAKK
jgi:hypothetical protein